MLTYLPPAVQVHEPIYHSPFHSSSFGTPSKPIGEILQYYTDGYGFPDPVLLFYA